MADIKQELDKIKTRISDANFLANKGLSNEVGIHVFTYEPQHELIVRDSLKEWLEEDPRHKAILFHSEAYPYGYRLAREFRSQTTFDDPNPVLI